MIGVTDTPTGASYTNNVHTLYFRTQGSTQIVESYERTSRQYPTPLVNNAYTAGDTFRAILEPQSSGFNYTIYKNGNFTTPYAQGSRGSRSESTLYPAVYIHIDRPTVEFYSIYAYDSTTAGGFDIKQGGSFGFVNNSGGEAIFSQGGFSLRSSNVDLNSSSLRLGDKFKFDGTDLIVSGTINATAGNIGGFAITDSAITGSGFLISGSATGNEFFISASNFNVKANGDLTASNATLTGTINATAGNIGGFAITDSAITGSGFLISGSATDNEFFISASNFNVKANGDLTASNADISGKITAQSGTIGGFTITQDALEGSNFYISGSATNEEFFISASKFNVKASGDITGSSVLFTGGRIAGFNITGSTLIGNDGAIVLYADSSAIKLDDGSNILDLRTGTLTTTSGTVQPSWSPPSNILSTAPFTGNSSGESTISSFQLTATGVHTDTVTLDQSTTVIDPDGTVQGDVTLRTGIRIRRGNPTTGTIVFDSYLPNVVWETEDGGSSTTSNATQIANIAIDNTSTTTYYLNQYYDLTIIQEVGGSDSWNITARTNISGNSLDLALPFDIVELTTSGIQVMSANNRYFRVRKIGSPLVDIAGELAVTGPITGSTLQTTGDTVIKGNLIVEGDTDISVGSVTGHPNITPGSNISINNSNGFVIQDLTLTLDSNGHVTTSTATSVDLDERYIQIGGISGFVETTGDEMTGKLTISSGGLEVTGSTDIKGQVSVNSGISDKVLDLRSTDEFATIYLSDDTTGPGAKGEAIRRHRDSLILRSNDNTTLIISGSNVGINDDTPEETLTVAGTAKVTGLVTGKAFRTLSSNNDYSLITRNDAAASFPLYVQNRIVSSDSKIARFAHSGNVHNDGQTVLELAGEKSYFDNTKLGIDTANPEYLLDIGAENVDNPTDFIRMNPTNGNGAGTTNTLGTGLIWKPHYTNYTKRSAGVVQVGEGNFFRSGLAFYTNNSADQTTDWQERMRIDKDGNVGINVTEPSATLHVDGDAIVTGRITAEEFHTEFVSASIVYQSGSTKFGNTSDDIHSFSGSLRVTGSGDHYFTDGNVGIGTNNPTYELDVAGDIGVNQYIYHNDDANTYIRFQPDDISLVANGNNLFRVDGGVNGTPKEIVVNESGADTDFRVESDTVTAALFVTGSTGNVGIGTTSPAGILDVVGSYTDNAVRVQNTNSSYFSAIGFVSSSGDLKGAMGVGNSGAGAPYANNAYVYTTAGTDFLVATGTTEKMRVTSGGNVGIGTTSPQAPLHVIAAGQNNNDLIQEWSYTPATIDQYSLMLKQTVTSGVVRYNFSMVNNNTAYNDVLVLDRGKVGIGTTSPTETLTVEGNISASGDLIVDEITAVNINVSGTLTATSIIETSTRELKNNIITLDSQEEIVDKLQPVSYTWKQDGVEDFGLIAEDVEEIAPHLVSRDDNGNPTGIKYSKLSVLLLDVVQKQNTLINDLNERITKLENERGN